MLRKVALNDRDCGLCGKQAYARLLLWRPLTLVGDLQGDLRVNRVAGRVRRLLSDLERSI
jgi:hypothetical protein